MNLYAIFCACSQKLFLFAIYVIVLGTTNCFECQENDNYTCILNQQSQTCRNGGRSLGITHCSAAKVTTWNVLTGMVDVSFVRGCIDCEGESLGASGAYHPEPPSRLYP